MTVLGRSSRMTAARGSLCWRLGCTSESRTPRVPRHLTAISLAALAASLAPVSGVPRVPISPAVRSRIPVLYPRCAIFSSVPPQVSSTSSGCAAIANRSRFIRPPFAVDSNSSTRGDAVGATICETRRRLSGFVGYGIVLDHVVCEKRQVFGGVRCSCYRVGEASWASGGTAPRGRGRRRHHPPPFFNIGRAVGGRRDRETRAAWYCYGRRSNQCF